MKIQGAVVKEQGITFAIIIVKRIAIDSEQESMEIIRSMSVYFPNMPIILMAQDTRGVPTYKGRRDIVNFLARIDIRRIPWKEYTIN